MPIMRLPVILLLVCVSIPVIAQPGSHPNPTNAPSAIVPPIHLEKAGINDVLALYGKVSGLTLLRWQILPSSTFDLQASPTNRAEAARILEQALRKEGLVSIPDGDKFLMVVPEWAASSIKPNSQKVDAITQSQAAFSAISMKGADVAQVLPFYAEILGRKLD